MDNQRQQHNNYQRNGGNRDNEYQNQDRGEQRQYDRRGPPQRYDNRDNDGGGYRGGRDGGGRGGRGGGYGGAYDRDGGNGGGRGGRGGGYGGRGGGYGGDNRDEYNNNGGQYDRKRRNDDEYDQRPPKRQYEEREVKPDPTPIDFEFEGNVAGQNVRFFYKEKEPVPTQLTAIHNIRIHGRLDNTLPFSNQNELVMFLANCGGLLKQGASLMDKTSSSTVPMNNKDVNAKMKTISQALFGSCELVEVDFKKLNLLQLPVFGRIPELKVLIEPESILDIGSIGINALIDWLHGRGKKGLKKLDFYTTNNLFARHFLHKLKQNNTDAQFVIRVTCPSPPLIEFTFNCGKKSQIKVVKEKDIKGGASFLIFKYAEGQPEPAKIRDREAYPKLSQISITNVPMPQPGSSN